MKKVSLLVFLICISGILISVSSGKDLPKIAVWDLAPGNIPPAYAQDLTSILVSEITKLGKYEVYSQENVRTLAGWTAERMTLGCTDTECLTALGQMDIAMLISGRIGKIGNTYSISLHLFDTQNVRAENSISEECKSEDELIPLVRQVVKKLLGIEVAPSKVEEKEPWKATTGLTSPLLGSPFTDPVAGMEFVFVKGGCFQMGDTFGDGDSDEKPVHEVCVDDFYLGKYEVTQGQWEKVMGNNPSYFKGMNNPVERVSWDDVQQFIDRLNNQSGRKYRLPTEAEWEYAARSGGKREEYSGTSQEAELGQYAWYGNTSITHAVGEKRPNGLGLYDMTGSVWEWCADWYDANYYKNSAKDNPRGPGNGQERVLRGGAWAIFASAPRSGRAANRDRSGPAHRTYDCGFRMGLSAR